MRIEQQRGFTVLELAMVVLISGLIITSVLAGYYTYRKNEQIRDTYAITQKLNDSLETFYSLNKRYPCPANPGIPASDPKAGVEDCAAPAAGTCSATGLCRAVGKTAVLTGSVPYQTINAALRTGNIAGQTVARADTLDGWSRHVNYAVTEQMTVRANLGLDPGAIRVVTEQGAVLTTGAYWVLYSSGENGLGAYTNEGKLSRACTGTTKDFDNCNAKTASANMTITNGLRSMISGTNYFDDIVLVNANKIGGVWDTTVSNSNNIVNRNAGALGIGTSTPREKLDVTGNLKASAGLAQQVCTNPTDPAEAPKCFDPSLLGGPVGLPCPSLAGDPPNTFRTLKGVENNTPVCSEPLDKPPVVERVTCPPGRAQISVDKNTGNPICDTKGVTPVSEGCGNADGTVVATAPTANLCNAGWTSSGVTGTGPWAWNCQETATGDIATCSANKTVDPPKTDAKCGDADKVPTSTKPSSTPTSNVCEVGSLAPTGITGTGPWSWACNSPDSGDSAACSAPVTGSGKCGVADKVPSATKPTINLCDITAASATPVAGDGPWTWTCTGTGTGSDANCSATKKVAGICGDAHNTTVAAKPSSPTDLCAAGNPTAVAGSGPWTWTCKGIETGSDSGQCKALKDGVTTSSACPADYTYDAGTDKCTKTAEMTAAVNSNVVQAYTCNDHHAVATFSPAGGANIEVSYLNYGPSWEPGKNCDYPSKTAGTLTLSLADGGTITNISSLSNFSFGYESAGALDGYYTCPSPWYPVVPAEGKTEVMSPSSEETLPPYCARTPPDPAAIPPEPVYYVGMPNTFYRGCAYKSGTQMSTGTTFSQTESVYVSYCPDSGRQFPVIRVWASGNATFTGTVTKAPSCPEDKPTRTGGTCA